MGPHAQLFYRNLMHACDAAGTFENEPAQLASYLYPMARDRVNKDTVVRWLLECQRAGLVTFHTDDNGRALGRFTTWMQRDTKRKVRYSNGKTNPDELPRLFTNDPDAAEKTHSTGRAEPTVERKTDPPRAPNQLNRIEGEGEKAPAPENQEDWLARLRAAHPRLDVDQELKAWAKYCQKHGKKPDRQHFERQWIANIGAPVEFGPGTAPTAPVEPEPEAWRTYLKDEYGGEEWASTAACYDWPTLPANWRAKIAREMGRTG
jgi:hypothetical protein